TSANPAVTAREIRSAQHGLPERTFKQEYLAQFSENVGGVFRGVVQASVAQPLSAPIPDHKYAAGVDFARVTDFTVVSIIDVTTRTQVALDRFNGVAWELQRNRIRNLHEVWQFAHIYAESNSIGGPNIEMLQRDQLPIDPFVTTASSKGPLIDELAF